MVRHVPNAVSMACREELDWMVRGSIDVVYGRDVCGRECDRTFSSGPFLGKMEENANDDCRNHVLIPT